MSDKRCSTCRFWTVRPNGSEGRCHRRPPRACYERDEHGVIEWGMWPPTEANDWCGEWSVTAPQPPADQLWPTWDELLQAVSEEPHGKGLRVRALNAMDEARRSGLGVRDAVGGYNPKLRSFRNVGPSTMWLVQRALDSWRERKAGNQ